MKSKQYKTLKSNLERLNDFAELIPGLIRVFPKVLVSIHFSFFSNLFSEFITKLLSDLIHFKSSVKDPKGKIKEIIGELVEKMQTDFIKESKKYSRKILKHKMFLHSQKLSSEASLILLASFGEAYFKDLFIAKINKRPKCALQFLEKEMKMHVIKEYGFNLSKKMGSIIAKKINFQDIDEVSKMYKRAFKISIFNNHISLKNSVQKLFQDRHLLVHNNGRIDRKYALMVKCPKNKIGKKIIIVKKTLDNYKESVLKVAANIEK